MMTAKEIPHAFIVSILLFSSFKCTPPIAIRRIGEYHHGDEQ